MDASFEEHQHKEGQKLHYSGVFQEGKKEKRGSDPMYDSKFIFCHLIVLDMRFVCTSTNTPECKGECPNEDQLLDADDQQIHYAISP